MTEAIRPRPGLLGRRPGVVSSSARPVAARRTAEARRPYHLGVFLGLSASAYAISLAGVTMLQSATEQASIAAQAPTLAALDPIAAGHDDIQRRLAGSTAAYDAAAAGYQRAGGALGALESQLDSLAGAVGKVTGVTSALPNHVALPSLPRVPVVGAAPAVHATTTASGQPLP